MVFRLVFQFYISSPLSKYIQDMFTAETLRCRDNVSQVHAIIWIYNRLSG